MQPDLLLILRVDPEIAVRRKSDENEDHVRTRSQEVWQTDWSDMRAYLVDAGQTPAKVLADLRSLIWQQI
jgi:thymidylate kinase